MDKINFKDGQLVKSGYVEIDGIQHTITEAEYSGETPLSAHNLNLMQQNIEEGINDTLEHKHRIKATTEITAGTAFTIPCKYKVGKGCLDVYLNEGRLILSSDDTGTNGHYREVGTEGSISNQIKTTSDWSVNAGDVFEFVVRGYYE